MPDACHHTTADMAQLLAVSGSHAPTAALKLDAAGRLTVSVAFGASDAVADVTFPRNVLVWIAHQARGRPDVHEPSPGGSRP